MTIWVVRHGRTEANAAGRLLGRANPELDALGREQAHRLAAAVPTGARVLTSPLRRCQETGLAITPAAEIDERLIELDYGELDLVPLRDVPAETWTLWRTDPDYRPPGGETLNELATRVSGLLDEVSDEAADRDVVLVTHVSPIKAALAWALGGGIEVSWRSFVAPASITRIGVTAQGPSLRSFNIETHLDGVGGVSTSGATAGGD